MCNHFRVLRADEVECRIGTFKEGKGLSLLLYKDARCDMSILDETVGAMYWKRDHQLVGDRLMCTVSIYDKDRNEWVSKQDVGTESNTEAVKGEASDSFKRACVCWGIGRELYTAPFIWIPADKFRDKNDKYRVTEMGVTDGKITKLVITNVTTNTVVYSFGPRTKAGGNPRTVAKIESAQLEMLEVMMTMKGFVGASGKVRRAVKGKDNKDITVDEYTKIMAWLREQPNAKEKTV